jgi:hypothetical protein
MNVVIVDDASSGIATRRMWGVLLLSSMATANAIAINEMAAEGTAPSRLSTHKTMMGG